MFWNRAPSTAGLEKARVDALAKLANLDVIQNHDEYVQVMDQIDTLSKLIEAEMPKPLSMDALVVAAANIGGIALIVGHERAHIVTSKAISFVGKFR